MTSRHIRQKKNIARCQVSGSREGENEAVTVCAFSHRPFHFIFKCILRFTVRHEHRTLSSIMIFQEQIRTQVSRAGVVRQQPPIYKYPSASRASISPGCSKSDHMTIQASEMAAASECPCEYWACIFLSFSTVCCQGTIKLDERTVLSNVKRLQFLV